MMNTQSTTFALFLVAAALVSGRVSAQTRYSQPVSELETSQQAHQLGEEAQRNEFSVYEVQKTDQLSKDALHWNAAVTRQSNGRTAVDSKALDSRRTLSATRNEADKPADRSIRITKKPATR